MSASLVVEDGDPHPSSAAASMGHKTIGFIGGVSLLVNNVLGPGVASIPALFQQAGWLAPSAFLIFCFFATVVNAEMILYSMQMMPQNRDLSQRVEFTSMCKHYFPKKTYIIAQIFYQATFILAIVSNVVQTGHVFDFVIDAFFGDSCAVELIPRPFHSFCGTAASVISPFDSGIVFSIGLAIVAASSVPLGFFNLDDNIIVQEVAIVLMMVCILAWFGIFHVLSFNPEYIPTLGADMSQVPGVMIFNFMLASTLPSWICEKRPEVSVFRTLMVTTGVAVALFWLIGVFGGGAFEPYYDSNDDLMSMLNRLTGNLSLLGKITANVYAIASNLSSIPVLSIVMRYNLINDGLLGPTKATLFSTVVPWLLCVVFYTGRGFNLIVNYGGNCISSVVNFIVPVFLFVFAARCQSRDDLPSCSASECLTPMASPERVKLLKCLAYPVVSITVLSVVCSLTYS